MSKILERIKRDKLKSAVIGTSIIIFIIGIVMTAVNTNSTYALTCEFETERACELEHGSGNCSKNYTTTCWHKTTSCEFRTESACELENGIGNCTQDVATACWIKSSTCEFDTESKCEAEYGVNNCVKNTATTCWEKATSGSGSTETTISPNLSTLTTKYINDVEKVYCYAIASTTAQVEHTFNGCVSINVSETTSSAWSYSTTYSCYLLSENIFATKPSSCSSGSGNTDTGDKENTEGGTSGGNSSDSGTETNPTYTITFNANGGNISQTSKSVTYNSTYGTLPTPTKIGHKFIGWYTEASGGTLITSTSSVKITSNQTLYAHWSVNKVKIKYKVEGGTITPSTTLDDTKHSWTTTTDEIIMQDGKVFYNSVDYGEKINKDGVLNYNHPNFVNIQKTGYTTEKGKEWKCLSGCTTNGKTYDQSYLYNDSDFCNAKDGDCEVTLGVNWVAIKYKIEYQANGGTNNGLPTEGTWNSNITINNPTKKVKLHVNENKTSATIGKDVEVEQEFTGWTSTTINENTAYHGEEKWTDGSVKVKDTTFKNLTSNNNGIVKMIANWEPKTVTLPTISKEGYTCNWNTKDDGKGTKYNSGAKYTIGSESSNTINLYGVCIADSKTDEELPSSPKTGDILIVVAWTIGIGTLGYTVYYFRSRKSNI